VEVKRNSAEEAVDDMLDWIHRFSVETWALHLLVNPDSVNLKDKKFWLVDFKT
jgi:hypothetical protein